MTEISDIGLIDVIAGKNNAGKSSILEAITITSHSVLNQKLSVELAVNIFQDKPEISKFLLV